MVKKIIVVHANQDVHDWMRDQHHLWDTQTPQMTPDQVWNSLDSGELAEDSAALLISDLLYQDYPEDVASLIASFASAIPVIIMQEAPELENKIKKAVKEATKEFNLTPAPYYWVDVTETEEPEIAINDIILAHSGETEQPEATSIDKYDPTDNVSSPQRETKPDDSQDIYQGYDPNSASNSAVHADERIETNGHTNNSYDSSTEFQNALGMPGMIVASTSTKGGSGKTTTALCVAITAALASEYAGRPLKVAVVDMDVRDGQIGFAINQTVPNALTLYLSKEPDPLKALQENMIDIPRWRISTLLAPKRAKTASYLDPQFYADALYNLRKLYDLIVLDTSVNYLDPLLSQVVYPESDAILLVTNLSKGAVLGMPRWMDEITSSDNANGEGIDKSKVGVVINQALGGVGMDLALVKKAARGAPLLVAVPSDNKAVTKASNEGTLNDLVTKHEKIAPEYFKLVKSLWGDRSPIVSPIEHYHASEEYQRDQQFKDKDNPNAVKTFTAPLSHVDEDKKPKRRRLFGR